MEAYANAADAKNGAISIIDNFVAKGSHPIEQGGKTLSLVDLSKFQALVEKLDSTTSTLVSNMG